VFFSRSTQYRNFFLTTPRVLMATLLPFRAVRPLPQYADEIASVPYDVVDRDEARREAADRPRSFLHVARPEIDLAPDVDLYDDAVYRQGARNLRRFVEADYTTREERPAVYVYRLEAPGIGVQTGILGGVSVGEYADGTIVKHEETRPQKEDDRTRHILEQRAHAEPVMLTYRDHASIHARVEQIQSEAPLYDFEAEDGVRHTVWTAEAPASLVEAFCEVEHLYIADGHHRCKAASRAAAVLRSVEDTGPESVRDPKRKPGRPPGYELFTAVLFPMSHMHIMAYNRVVRRVPGAPVEFLDRLDAAFGVERNVEEAVPSQKGHVCLYLAGAWHRLALPPATGPRTVDALDVSRLSDHLLEPYLDITDQRRDPTIDFVGGIRGPEALEARVDRGDAQLAISMYPTSIEELVAVSDEGSLMPPKSTWFAPKLRSGLLVHDFAAEVPADAPTTPLQ
jgi:uncharacterized protein (DUF1015 family)